jgi:signal transduction histidine kinase/CheY-like chemotaxis protein
MIPASALVLACLALGAFFTEQYFIVLVVAVLAFCILCARERAWVRAISELVRDGVYSPTSLRDYLLCSRFRGGRSEVSISTQSSITAPGTVKLDGDDLSSAAALLAHQSSASCVAIARAQEDGDVRFYSYGPFSPSLEAELRIIVGAYFSDTAPFVWGLRDHALSQNIFGNPLAFGYRYSWLAPLHSTGSRTLLWMGFPEQSAVSDQKILLLKTLAARLDFELMARAEHRKMSLELRELESESREKAECLANLSHDMRSPLNNIKSILNVVRLEDESGKQGELFKIALRNCDELGAMIEDVLDLTKHRAGYLRADKCEVELHALLRDVVASFSHRAAAKGLSLSLVANQPAFVLVDARQLRRVIANLLANAINYTERGSVVVRLEADGDSRWRVAVRDTGPGIAKADQIKLFTPFVRLRGAHGVEGTGLGLALSRVFVDLNGGKMGLESQLGEGSEFSFSFPAIESEAVISSPASSTHAHSCPNGFILAVDDDSDGVQSLARLLETQKLRVHTALGVDAALCVVNYSVPELIICDGQMPGGGAERLLSELRQRNLTIPVVVLTGDAERQSVARYLQAGAKEVLTKPAEPIDLLAAMERATAHE